MGFTDAFWHLLNFLAPAVFTGALAAALVKLLWWRELAGAGWLRLAGWSAAAGALALAGALVGFGRDGTMAGYGLMTAACALALWWAAFLRRR